MINMPHGPSISDEAAHRVARFILALYVEAGGRSDVGVNIVSVMKRAKFDPITIDDVGEITGNAMVAGLAIRHDRDPNPENWDAQLLPDGVATGRELHARWEAAREAAERSAWLAVKW